MFAVVKTGGKQYRVALDDVITVEKLNGDAGAEIALSEVLMVGDDQGVKVGSPFIAGVSVAAEIVEQTRGDKVLIFKKRRRHHYRKHGGHRQDLTMLRITGIGDVKSTKPKAEKKAKAAPAETKAEKQPAAKKAAPKKAAAEKKPAAKKPAAKKPAKKA
ncbi:MAG: 50S ribosomal protein L21 [Sphingomonadales bacterium]|nr:50S ribosomal protein L21 [Sphingomonadales bacterium]